MYMISCAASVDASNEPIFHDFVSYNIFQIPLRPFFNKTKDWALVQNAALVMKIKVLKLGLVR